MLMVGTDPVEVERMLAGGLLVCPGCAGRLRPWGWARWLVWRFGGPRGSVQTAGSSAIAIVGIAVAADLTQRRTNIVVLDDHEGDRDQRLLTTQVSHRLGHLPNDPLNEHLRGRNRRGPGIRREASGLPDEDTAFASRMTHVGKLAAAPARTRVRDGWSSAS